MILIRTLSLYLKVPRTTNRLISVTIGKYHLTDTRHLSVWIQPAPAFKKITAYVPHLNSRREIHLHCTIQGYGEFEPFIKKLREVLLDNELANDLLNSKEFSNETLYKALRFSLETINTAPPMQTAFGILTFPRPQLIIDGALVYLYRSLMLLEYRNQLNYANSQINVGIHDKGPIYQQLYNQFKQEFEMKVAKFKSQYNVENSWSGVFGLEYGDWDYSWLPDIGWW